MTTPAWFEFGMNHPGAPGDVMVEGARIHFETWGEVGQPGVILIHGSNAHLHWWRFVAPYLARKYRVAAIDLSGNGDSDHRERYSDALYAQEVWSVCEAADLGERPFVVGHSFGGWVALQTAHYYSASMGGLILNDFTVVPPEEYLEWGLAAEREGRTEPRKLRVYDDLDAAVGRFRLIPEQPMTLPEVTQWIARQSLKAVEGGWTWKFDPAMYDYLEMGDDQHLRYANLECRSGVVLGELTEDEGAFGGPWMRSITADAVPLITLPHCHHHMMFEEPLALTAAFEGLIDGWLAADRADESAAALAQLKTL